MSNYTASKMIPNFQHQEIAFLESVLKSNQSDQPTGAILMTLSSDPTNVIVGADTASCRSAGVLQHPAVASQTVRLYHPDSGIEVGPFVYRPGAATNAMIGRAVCIVDNQTVDLTANTTNAVAFGRITRVVDATHVIVKLTTGDVDADVTTIENHLLTANKVIDLPIGAFTLNTGAALTAYSADPTPGFALVNSKAMGIKWGSHANPTPIMTTFSLPPELNNAANATLEILASKVGATIGDAVTFTCALYNQVVGALHDADSNFGGASSAMTGDATSKTVQKCTLTLAAANLPNPIATDAATTLLINPTDGLLGTDDVIIHAVRIRFTGELLAS